MRLLLWLNHLLLIPTDIYFRDLFVLQGYLIAIGYRVCASAFTIDVRFFNDLVLFVAIGKVTCCDPRRRHG